MPLNRNGAPLHGLPDPTGFGYHAQKVILAELVIDPPRPRDKP